MSKDPVERTRETWETVDYIGGGFVLQKKMKAIVEKRYTHNYRTNGSDFTGAEVIEVQDAYRCNVKKNEHGSSVSGRVKHVEQPHRVVHLSELEGVSMSELMNDVDERGGLK